MNPWLADPDVRLFHGDALEVLRELPSGSAHMCATSPPFWSLRDYQSEGQIGLEPTIDEWVGRLVQVFDEVKRVLRDDATLWIEIGDSFSDKQLVGQPWRLAFALQRAGWFLRSEIIWSRSPPNPMPESVTDRPTKSHSTVFMLSKRPRYFFDADAIREASKEPGKIVTLGPKSLSRGQATGAGVDASGNGLADHVVNPSTANARSVWQIPTEPTPFAHFATWPQALVRRMILAGTSERGACPECGAPWVRETESSYQVAGRGNNNGARKGDDEGTMASRPYETRMLKTTSTLGWSPSCTHDAAPVPCVVLDCFAGSGTTSLVARNHGRHSIGIELNQSYLEIAARRLQQLSLLAGGAA